MKSYRCIVAQDEESSTLQEMNVSVRPKETKHETYPIGSMYGRLIFTAIVGKYASPLGSMGTQLW